MNTYDSECFPIGLGEYPVSIDYTTTFDGEREVTQCMVEIAASDFTVWAKVDPEYFPAIEKQLEIALEQDKDEADKYWTPSDDVPQFLRRQAS